MNNKLHRENGPAVIYYYENGNIEQEAYFIHSKLHRLDGSAEIRYSKGGNIKLQEYYINGKKYNELEYFIKVGILRGEKYNGII